MQSTDNRIPDKARRIGWAVRVASGFVPGATCLTQALAAEYLLVEAGFPATLRIGARKASDNGVAAHAWVESGGEVVIGDVELDSFTRLTRAPAE